MSEFRTVMPSRILLPEGVDLQKWACIACDQHTSELDYWKNFEQFVGKEKSALNLVLPEIYLGEEDERIKVINENMLAYSSSGIFKEYEGYVLTVRTLNNGAKRVGIVLSIKLDDYSYESDSDALIRATEETVVERIPARVKIRENATLELPHVMLLSNDTTYSYIDRLYAKRDTFQKIYDFDLYGKGGKVEGYFIPKEENVCEMFQKAMKNGILFLVGDGNHSLASAKAVWESKKAEGKGLDDLCAYAMVEVVDLNSSALEFEAIHRLVKGVDVKDFCNGLSYMLGGNGVINVITSGFDRMLYAPENVPECYDFVQAYIDNYIAEKGGEVDYIHGLDVLRKRAEESSDAVGITMPALNKKELFGLVEKYGSLPRKTFSMGEGDDKRYYLEARKIKE